MTQKQPDIQNTPQPTQKQSELVRGVIETLEADGVIEPLNAPNGVNVTKAGGLVPARLPPHTCGRVTIVLANLLEGIGWQEALSLAGISWGELNLLQLKYPRLKGIINACEALKLDLQRRKVRGRLLDLAVNGQTRHVIGRVGRDEDGILRHPETGELLTETKYSEKLLQFVANKLDKPFQDAPTPQQQAVAPTTAIGSQTIYAVQLPNWVPSPQASAPMPVTPIEVQTDTSTPLKVASKTPVKEVERGGNVEKSKQYAEKGGKA